ncbi:MAG: bifunctional 5,10-methylenetetrahydrofolate dehydrogenase/5,10-methenyltetrahydrofolate cyclohydrolase [Acidobacteriota bacterium]
MSAMVLDGQKVAAELRQGVAREVAELAAGGAPPRLDAILVGDDPASGVYVGAKARACQEVGIRSETRRLPATTTPAELRRVIGDLNADAGVDGILLQLPLPAPLESRAFLDLIDPAKDVDGFHPANVGLLHQGRPRFVPCTPAGIIALLDAYGIALEGRRAVVLGRSEIVGKPMAALLLARHATVTICHSRSRDLAAICREAELLIAAIGKPALVTGEFVRAGATVVDVGVNRVESAELVARLYPGDAGRLSQVAKKGYTLVGDVDFVPVSEVAGAITPVPGGVGPLTIAGLLRNTVTAARARRGA